LGDFLKNNNIKDVIISGIATEFCVKETAMDFFKNNFNVVILEKNLAYVNEQNHIKTLKELSENIKIV
jgi:Amidases related to nicotinamidase